MYEKKRLLHFIGAAYVNGYLWVSALEWNGYYKVDIGTGKSEFLGLFKRADVLADKLFNQVLAYEKYVFFIPWFSNHLVRLDTDNLNTKYWELPSSIVVEVAKFRAANIYDKKIFMFPHCGNDICIFDIEKEEFECNRIWLDEFLENVKWNKEDKFLQGYQKNEMVWLPNLSGGFIMKFSLMNYEYEIILFPENEKRIVDIVEDKKNNLLILTEIGNVWEYGIDDGHKELKYKYHGKIKEPYRHVISTNNKLYLVPSKEKNIYVITGKKKNILSYPFEWKLQYINVGIESIFSGYFKDGEKFIFYPCLGNMLLKIDSNKANVLGTKIYEEDIIYRRKEIIKHIKYIDISERILSELRLDLRLFLDVIVKCKRKEKRINYLRRKNVQIWNIVKGNKT